MGWRLELDPEGREHCYTTINGNYVDDGYELGELENFKATYEKVVYYFPECPLIDLKHEFDHVQQMERIASNRKVKDSDTATPYLPSDWKYKLGGEENGWDELDSQVTHGAQSSFLSDAELEKRENINKLYNKGTEKDLNLRDLSWAQNEVLEYHAYLRELARMDRLGISKSKQEEIILKIKEHETEAEKLIDSEDDEVVEACNNIESFEALKAQYNEIKTKIES
jgi:hypothetical protein